MATTNKRVQTRMMLPKMIAKGVAAAMIVVVLGAMLITTFAVSGSITEKNVSIGVIGVLLVGAGIGSTLIGKKLEEKKLVSIIIYVCCVLGILAILNAVIYDGVFIDAFLKIAAVLVGGSFGAIMKGKRNRKKIKIRNR